MKDRYQGIDLLRSIALLLVLFHHFYVLTGNVLHTGIWAIDLIIMFGGEIGVTLFFCISGFGIYWSLKKRDMGYKLYAARRAKRILPQYYVCLLIALMVGDGAYSLYIGHGAASILAHIFMIHNLYPPYAGAINGSLWTMGVMVQFYLIAPTLYRCLKKYGNKVIPISIIITVSCKICLIRYLLPYFGLDINFWASRQLLFTTWDNFVMGMGVAYFIDKKRIDFKIKAKEQWLGILLSCAGIIAVCYGGMKIGMYSNNWCGYMVHSVLAITVCYLMFFMAIKQYRDSVPVLSMLWLSKYEYGIYLWHLLFVRDFIEKAPIYPALMNIQGGVWIVCVILLIGSVILGWVSTVTIDSVEWNWKLLKK